MITQPLDTQGLFNLWLNIAMQLPFHRQKLRPYQQEIIQAYNNPTIDELLLIIARRGGKTTTVFSEGVVPDLVRETQTIVMVYPTAQQGFRNFWNNIENDGFKTIEHMPEALIVSKSNTVDDMRFTLINGSVFMVVGSTNVEALRGANGKKYIFDEFADMPIEAVNVVAPIVENNGGKMVYMGTPKIDGINGETMRRMHESFKKQRNKYTCYIDATHYMTPKQLEKSRQGYIERNGNDFKFKQEMLLDWGQSSSGSYYGDILAKKRKDGTIGEYPYLKAHPVYTTWDLGRADNMAVVFWQYLDGVVRIIDSYQTAGVGLNSVIPHIKAQPYIYGWHFLSWDAVVHSTNDNVRRIDYMISQGLPNSSALRKEGISIGIDRVVTNLPKTLINEPTNVELLRKLALYKRKPNPITGDWIGPDHTSASHYADAVRYIWTAIAQNWIDGEFAYAPEKQPDKAHLEYDTEELEATYYF